MAHMLAAIDLGDFAYLIIVGLAILGAVAKSIGSMIKGERKPEPGAAPPTPTPRSHRAGSPALPKAPPPPGFTRAPTRPASPRPAPPTARPPRAAPATARPAPAPVRPAPARSTQDWQRREPALARKIVDSLTSRARTTMAIAAAEPRRPAAPAQAAPDAIAGTAAAGAQPARPAAPADQLLRVLRNERGLRSAILLSEILSPPVSLRDER